MVTVKDIFSYFESVVPTKMKMEHDNPGFLVGNSNRTVERILITLDITDDVICEAIENKVDLIVSHHPLFFSINSANTETLIGRKIVAMLESGISAICLHTNLDAARNGVNDTLMKALGIEPIGILDPYGFYENGEAYGMGRYGRVEEMSLHNFLSQCKSALNCNGLRYVNGENPVKNVAVCGGSGSSMLQIVADMGCDTYVTGDVKHNGFLDAKELGINLIDAGHFSTENIIVPVLKDMLDQAFPPIKTIISSRHKQPEEYYV